MILTYQSLRIATLNKLQLEPLEAIPFAWISSIFLRPLAASCASASIGSNEAMASRGVTAVSFRRGIINALPTEINAVAAARK